MIDWSQVKTAEHGLVKKNSASAGQYSRHLVQSFSIPYQAT